MLGAAIGYHQRLGPQAVEQAVRERADHLRGRLGEMPGVDVRDLGTEPCGIVSFTVQDVPALQKRDRLRGVGVVVSRAASTPLDMDSRDWPRWYAPARTTSSRPSRPTLPPTRSQPSPAAPVGNQMAALSGTTRGAWNGQSHLLRVLARSSRGRTRHCPSPRVGTNVAGSICSSDSRHGPTQRHSRCIDCATRAYRWRNDLGGIVRILVRGSDYMTSCLLSWGAWVRSCR